MRKLRIGLLLGWRQIQRASIWTNILIVFVMALTFLNLVAVSGILVGLIVGSERAVQRTSLGDVIITPLDDEEKLLQTDTLERNLDTVAEIAGYSTRYMAGGTIEAGVRERRDLEAERNLINARFIGIDPEAETQVTNLPDTVVEGSYLDPNETGYILVGALNLDRYTAGFADIIGSLTDVYPGDSVRVTINGNSQDFTVKGIINTKVGEVSSAVFIPDEELERLLNIGDTNASEIAIRLQPEANPDSVKAVLLNLELDSYAKIRTFTEALPKFITDIKNTFNILGLFIGAVGIIVASITIFIIIFINAISRQRQIGILKGIGIDSRVIEIAYIFQAGLYAAVGSGIGILITYSFLVGYFERNPVNFPFSDGILVAPVYDTLIRFIVLFVVTLGAGFVPAWMITRKNTLNSILGRK